MTNKPSKPAIENVSDTAIWVAHYRALETDSKNPLFRDPLAKVLTGDRAKQIAESMKSTSAHTRHNVLIRTVIIDRFIQKLVSEGIERVINLGAGFDTRPYRLALPASLEWIEIDYPHMIQFKDEQLKNEKPVVQLKRIPLDLAERENRKKLFTELNAQSKKTLILTEGVIPYLSEVQASDLAEDLKAQAHFQLWITDYMSPLVYRFIQTPARIKALKNAPFQFFPADPEQFFASRGWKRQSIEYINEESIKLKRMPPAPWYAFLFRIFLTPEKKKIFLQFSGYQILERSSKID